MENLTANRSRFRLPGWAFLLGWSVTIGGINHLVQSILQIPLLKHDMTWTSTLGTPYAEIISGWAIVYSLIMTAVGILILRTPTTWKRGILTISILSLATSLFFLATWFTRQSDFSNLDPAYIAHLILYYLHRIAVPVMLLWLVCRLESFPHPDVSTLVFYLSMAFVSSLIQQLDWLVSIVIENKQASPSVCMFCLAWILPLLYPLLALSSAVAIHRHPYVIQKKLKPVFLVVAVLWGVGILIKLMASLSSWGTPAFFIVIGYTVDNLYVYLLPMVLAVLASDRYRRSFRVADNFKFGIKCCTQCGYDLTGNTSGICPECGQSLFGTKNSGSP